MVMKTNELEGKTVLVTGANSGIGKAVAQELARKSASVIIVSRDMARGNAALQDIKEYSGSRDVHLYRADLSSLAEVENIASAFHRQSTPLDLLINNAAIVPAKRELSRDGLELQFAVNYLAHFYLSKLMIEFLQKSPEARIINVSSVLHYRGKPDFEDLQTEKRPYKAIEVYSMTKLLNVMHSLDLAEDLRGTTVSAHAVHPGAIATNIYRAMPAPLRVFIKAFMKSPAKGAETPLFAAIDPSLSGTTGKYFEKKKEKEPHPTALDASAREKLREISEGIIHQLRGS